MKILVINGPNLNMLGNRESSIYGKLFLEDVEEGLSKRALELGLEVKFFQSNYEGAIVDLIQNSIGEFAGLIINPAAYTHTSIAIRDALLLLNIPIIEVHLSNIYGREFFRRKSLISDIVSGHISGFGVKGYFLALRAMYELCI